MILPCDGHSVFILYQNLIYTVTFCVQIDIDCVRRCIRVLLFYE